jgi:probable HAF family extracellular repeat protein
MKSKKLMCIAAMALLATLAIPVQLAGQRKARQRSHHKYHHYQLIDVGTFGGPQSFLSSGFDINPGIDVNQRGALVGSADTPLPDPFSQNCFTDCYLNHAFRLQNGVRADLGVLVDGFSSTADGGINDGGLIAGTAENGEIDPLIPAFPELRSVLWENRIIHDLGTLPGGYESYSTAINNRGQIVGVASNATPDANSMSFPGYQARAFLWDQQQGMQDLGTLSGGTDAIAAMINTPGQVAGWSYTSSSPNANCFSQFTLTTGSFIWDKQNGMRDLGSFGGTCTLAADLNNRGQVVGQSNLTGDQVSHAFIWDRSTGLTDLGTLGGSHSQAFAINQSGEAVGGAYLPGDLQFDAVLWRKNRGKWQTTDLGILDGGTFSFAVFINASGQVVGDWDFGGFLWEDGGPMVDLNSLVSPGSAIQVGGVQTINDHGDIAAVGFDANSNAHALLLIPCDENHGGVVGCDYSLVDAAAAAHTVHATGAIANSRNLSASDLTMRFRSLRAGRNRRYGTLQTSTQ